MLSFSELTDVICWSRLTSSLPASPSCQSLSGKSIFGSDSCSIIPELHLSRHTCLMNRVEQVTETPFKQRGECTQPSPWRRLFHHACVRGHALKKPRTNSFKPNTTIVSVQRSCVGTQLSIHGCLCTPSMHWCTAACGAAAAAAADVMLVGEEEVVISQRQKVQHVYFYTGVLLFSLADHQRQPMRHVCDWLGCFRDKLPEFLHHPQLP